MTGQGKEKPALHEERQMVAIKSWSIVIKMQSITTFLLLYLRRDSSLRQQNLQWWVQR